VRIRPALLLLALALLAGAFAPQTSAASVKWRFEVDGQYILQPPALAPDGTVAVTSSTGTLYSLTPAGALRWSVPAVGGDGGPSYGPDGTVYVGRMDRITAVAPDGTVRWTFVEPGSSQGVIAGPTVGPDGNVYVVSDIGGLGAYSLSPTGQLRWSNPGNPVFLEYGQLGAEIVFDAERMFVAFDEYGVAPTNMLYALTLGGTQQWAVSVPSSDDIFMQRQAQPATGPDGSLYLTGMSGSQGWQLVRFNPANGSVVWTFRLEPANGMSPPTVGPDGSVYYSRSLGFLDAVTSGGDGRWTFFDETIVDLPRVNPERGARGCR
jgi:outer membrane protein assembly factor BamB